MTAESQPESPTPQPAPIIPLIQEIQPRSTIPAEVSQAIAGVPPSEALMKVDSWVKLEYEDREKARLHQLEDRDKERAHQIELAKIAQETEILKENNRASERKADRTMLQKTLLWGSGIFGVIFISALVYASVEDDSEIANNILVLGAGLLGGGGATALVTKKSDQDETS